MGGPFLDREWPENLAFDFGGPSPRLLVYRVDIGATAVARRDRNHERAVRILASPGEFATIWMSQDSSAEGTRLKRPRSIARAFHDVDVGIDERAGRCRSEPATPMDVVVYERDRAWLWGFSRSAEEVSDQDFDMLLRSVQWLPAAFYERLTTPGLLSPEAAAMLPKTRPQQARSAIDDPVGSDDSHSGPARPTHRVVQLPHLSVPVHVYETRGWDGGIDDKIENGEETAIVVTRGTQDSLVHLGTWQVWVDGRNVSYEESEAAAIAAIRHHREEYEPVEGKSGMAPSNWTQDAMDALRRLSVESVRIATKHPGGWANPFSEMQSDVCYRPELEHGGVRGWWELRWPRAGQRDAEVLTYYRKTKGEAAETLCQNWLDEITARADEEGRAITERILFLAEVSAMAVPDEPEEMDPALEGAKPTGSASELVTWRELVRDRFLVEAWRQASGDSMKLIDGGEIAQALGLPRADARIAANYLEERGLIREQGTRLLYLLTTKGIDAAEALARPSGADAATARTVDYDVALTFAGEQRAYVYKVAAGLADRGISVFYDAYETVLMWGKDLGVHLVDLYENRAKYVVIFSSADYARKAWTTVERKAAQARAVNEKREYILPARFDDTPIPGVAETVGYIDLRVTTPAELVGLVVAKVA